MAADDLTVEVLKDIRSEIRTTNERVDSLSDHVDSLSGRVDSLSDHVDGMREDLGRRIVESEMRTATAITDLAGSMKEMTGVLRASLDLRPRVETCEREIAALKEAIAVPRPGE